MRGSFPPVDETLSRSITDDAGMIYVEQVVNSDEEKGRVTPRSFLVARVSKRVFITVSKITTLRGSP